jgi:peptidoglycan-associated lipoprotein
MKMNKMIFPLVIALTAVLATTGCKKGITKVTPLPNSPAIVSNNDNTPRTLPSAPPFGPGSDVTSSTNTGIVETGTWDPTNMTQDRATLAAQTVHFAFDSAAVIESEESKLIIVSEALKSDPTAKLLIEGHCDERGTEEYNRALGERRALALREDLAKAGIDPERMRTISYGKDKPVETSHDEAAWSKNRRGEFVLCHPKSGMQ